MSREHKLDSEQRHTLEHLSSHPLATNIKWPQVLALLEAMGEVIVESKERYRVTVDGHTEVFRPPHHHGDVPAEMVMKLRRFLASALGSDRGAGGGLHLLVVVDHRSATIYEFEPPGERIATVLPYDPRGRLRHLHHIDGNYQGQRTPEDPGYYAAIVEAVRDADTIVIFGHGDGHSDAARLLRDCLSEALPAPTPRMVVEVRIDAKSFTEPQLLVAARRAVEVEHENSGEFQ